MVTFENDESDSIQNFQAMSEYSIWFNTKWKSPIYTALVVVAAQL